MIDYQKFVDTKKSMVIAPAGYGKTHTIAESLKHTEDQGLQLVLTHTHAGVASIKQKIKKEGIQSSQYRIETISSFAQKYACAFYNGTDIPAQEDSKEYHQFIIAKASEILELGLVQSVISNTYGGLFVDEYQDCTVEQHDLILKLSKILPAHILGDPLQGIFDFGGQTLTNLEDKKQMGDFLKYKVELTTPHRWAKTNKSLGKDIDSLRRELIQDGQVTLSKYSSIEHHKCDDAIRSGYYEIIKVLKNEKSLLIIDPRSHNIASRIKLVQRLHNIPRLLESIDHKSFYELAKKIESLQDSGRIGPKEIREICLALFGKTETNKWLNEKGLVKKSDTEAKQKSGNFKVIYDSFISSQSLEDLVEVIRSVNNLLMVRCYRKELLASVCRTLVRAENENISITQSMLEDRNLTRRVGRKVIGKCVGTTLLTKGLEFDVVIVVNAHEFKCPKNLYVALTRGSKRLVVFSAGNILKPV